MVFMGTINPMPEVGALELAGANRKDELHGGLILDRVGVGHQRSGRKDVKRCSDFRD